MKHLFRQDLIVHTPEQSNWSGDAELIIPDAIHKYKKWKSLVKGEYDKLKDKYRLLITGSARLDLYRKGGDSMLGRYHYYRLHPFTMAYWWYSTDGIPNFFFDILSISSAKF